MKYRLSSIAQDDLVEAAHYYDLQRDGLGAEFMIEVGIGIARILDAPGSWPEIEPGCANTGSIDSHSGSCTMFWIEQA